MKKFKYKTEYWSFIFLIIVLSLKWFFRETENLLFWFLLVLFIFMIIFFIKSKNNILDYFKSIRKNYLVLVFLIGLAAFVVNLFFPNFHSIYMDEHYYNNVAMSMLRFNEASICEPYGMEYDCELTFVPAGGSFLTALFLNVYPNVITPFIINLLFGFLSVFSIFFFVFALLKNEKIALIAAVLFAFFNQTLFYTNTTHVFISFMLFFFITNTVFIIYQRENSTYMGLLFWAIFSFTVFIRTESVILVLLYIPYLFFSKRISFDNLKKKFLPFIIFLGSIFILKEHLPTLFGIHDITIPNVENFSFNLFINQSMTEFVRLINGTYFHFIFLILAVLGIYFLSIKNKREMLFLLFSFLIFFFVYNFFNNQGQTKFFLITNSILLVFVAVGIYFLYLKFNSRKLSSTIAALLIVIFIVNNISLTNESFEGNLDLLSLLPNLIEEEVVGCYIVAEEPLIFSDINDIGAVNFGYYLSNKKFIDENYDCLLFFEELYCSNRKGCQDFVNQNPNLSIFNTYKDNDESYIIFRLS